MDITIRPRVLMLTSTLPRWVGDAEPGFVLDLARELNTDFDVELVAPHAEGAARRELLQGVPVTRFRYWLTRWQSAAYGGGMAWRLRENPARLAELPFFFGSLGWTVARRLRREPRIDLIHAHWLVPQGLAALIARRVARREIPVLCTSHGGDLFGLKGRLLERLKAKILQSCDAVTVVSQAMASKVSELSPGVEAAVIPMGTDLHGRFTNTGRVQSEPLRRLLFAGRLVPKKGLEHLLEALVILRSHHPEVSLEVVGHGPLRDPLLNRARTLGLDRCVQFVGPVPHDRLADHYRRADIAVFPFVEAADGDQEGFGLVMVEAMGCGCAVVASDLPAVRDVIEPGVTGMLVPPRDPAALADGVAQALKDPEATRAMAARGRSHALEHFDWDRTRLHFSALYGSLIQSNAVRP